MLCKLCFQNETDNTSGICWKCVGKTSNIGYKTVYYKVPDSALSETLGVVGEPFWIVANSISAQTVNKKSG